MFPVVTIIAVFNERIVVLISNFIWKPCGIGMLRLHFYICAAFEETALQALA